MLRLLTRGRFATIATPRVLTCATRSIVVPAWPAAAAAATVAAARSLQAPRSTLMGAVRHGSGAASSGPDLEELSDEFAEARELLSDAEEAIGTTYFEEDLEDARIAVEQVLERYDSIKASLPEGSDELMNLQRSLGLRMEELRGRYSLLIENLVEDH